MAAGRLRGRRVLVTRPADRAGPLVAALEAEGAEVISFPTIEVAPPEERAPLEGAAKRLDAWDWVVFTSVYGVRALAEAGARPAGGNAGPRCGCVGPATSRAARSAGWSPAVVPADSSAAGLLAALLERADMAGARVLLPRAADAREELAVGLRAAGANVDEVVAYRKVVPGALLERTRTLVGDDFSGALTFTSPSTVRNFIRLWGDTPSGVRVVVIGPTTAEAAGAAGLRVSVVAEEASVRGLVEAVIQAFNG